MNPVRKRVAIMIVMVGGGLIADRVISFDHADAAPSLPPAAARARVPAPAERPASGAGLLLRLDKLEARIGADDSTPEIVALFAPNSWQPEAASAPAATPPPAPKPSAPPFPYTYLGGMLDDAGARTGFFAKGETVVPLRPGDSVEGYRVEDLTESEIRLTYLPLNEKLTMNFGSPR